MDEERRSREDAPRSSPKLTDVPFGAQSTACIACAKESDDARVGAHVRFMLDFAIASCDWVSVILSLVYGDGGGNGAPLHDTPHPCGPLARVQIDLLNELRQLLLNDNSDRLQLQLPVPSGTESFMMSLDAHDVCQLRGTNIVKSARLLKLGRILRILAVLRMGRFAQAVRKSCIAKHDTQATTQFYQHQGCRAIYEITAKCHTAQD
eukprot:5709387-Amphidinium_carterae.1